MFNRRGQYSMSYQQQHQGPPNSRNYILPNPPNPFRTTQPTFPVAHNSGMISSQRYLPQQQAPGMQYRMPLHPPLAQGPQGQLFNSRDEFGFYRSQSRPRFEFESPMDRNRPQRHNMPPAQVTFPSPRRGGNGGSRGGYSTGRGMDRTPRPVERSASGGGFAPRRAGGSSQLSISSTRVFRQAPFPAWSAKADRTTMADSSPEKKMVTWFEFGNSTPKSRKPNGGSPKSTAKTSSKESFDKKNASGDNASKDDASIENKKPEVIVLDDTFTEDTQSLPASDSASPKAPSPIAFPKKSTLANKTHESSSDINKDPFVHATAPPAHTRKAVTFVDESGAGDFEPLPAEVPVSPVANGSEAERETDKPMGSREKELTLLQLQNMTLRFCMKEKDQKIASLEAQVSANAKAAATQGAQQSSSSGRPSYGGGPPEDPPPKLNANGEAPLREGMLTDGAQRVISTKGASYPIVQQMSQVANLEKKMIIKEAENIRLREQLFECQRENKQVKSLLMQRNVLT